MSLSQQESWYKKEVFGQSSTNLQEIVNKAKYLDVVKMKEVLDKIEENNRNESLNLKFIPKGIHRSFYRGDHDERGQRNIGELIYPQGDRKSESIKSLKELTKKNPLDIQKIMLEISRSI